jgi:DHA2 family multidrug resistance protein
LPAASGLANFVRITMGAVGTSVSTTVWDDRATLHRVHMVEHLGGQGDAVIGDALGKLSGVGLDAQQAAAQLSRLIDQQAFTRAVDDVFYVSSLLFIVMIIAVWFTRRAARPRADASASATAAH